MFRAGEERGRFRNAQMEVKAQEFPFSDLRGRRERKKPGLGTVRRTEQGRAVAVESSG